MNRNDDWSAATTGGGGAAKENHPAAAGVAQRRSEEWRMWEMQLLLAAAGRLTAMSADLRAPRLVMERAEQRRSMPSVQAARIPVLSCRNEVLLLKGGGGVAAWRGLTHEKLELAIRKPRPARQRPKGVVDSVKYRSLSKGRSEEERGEDAERKTVRGWDGPHAWGSQRGGAMMGRSVCKTKQPVPFFNRGQNLTSFSCALTPSSNNF